MNIVIKDGTGFIGQAVAEVCLKADHAVFVTGHEAPVQGPNTSVGGKFALSAAQDGKLVGVLEKSWGWSYNRFIPAIETQVCPCDSTG
jgi:nucleoside-diphosphate-sugar epimerase